MSSTKNRLSARAGGLGHWLSVSASCLLLWGPLPGIKIVVCQAVFMVIVSLCLVSCSTVCASSLRWRKYAPKPLSCIIFSDGVIATVSSRARLVLLLSSSISSAHASSQIWRKYAPKPLFSIIFGAGVIVTVSIFFSCLAFVLKCLVFVCSRIISNLETVCTRTRLQHHLQCRSDRELCCVVS